MQPQPPVLRGFDPPALKWAAGHRGIDLAADPGAVVHAVASGTVTHVGVIAGRGTATVTHADGVRSTYEPIEPEVALGDTITKGQRLGRVSTVEGHCRPRGCLHLGAKRGDSYLNPLLLLGSVRIVLLPPVP